MKIYLPILIFLLLTNFVFAEGKFFVHSTSSTNVFYNYTRINNTELNGDPNAKILVNHVYNPGGIGGTYHDHVVGIWYDGYFWNIYNEDLTTMPIDVHFNVFVGDLENFYVHQVTLENRIDGVSTILPEELAGEYLFFSNYFQGIYNNNTYLWDFIDGRTYLFNSALTSIPIGSSFLVYKPIDEQIYTQPSGAENTAANYTVIDVFFLEGNPNAKFIVNVNFSPSPGPPILDKNIGLRYNGEDWVVYTEDLSDMPYGVYFDILFSYNEMAISEENLKVDVQIYPNPVQNVLKVNSNEEILTIQILNSDGRIMGNYGNLKEIEIQHFPSGVYFIQVQTKSEMVSRKFLKK